MNHYSQLSKLHMRVKKGEARNYLDHVEFTAPFKITKPFYDAQNHMKIMMLSVSAGIMEGDRQEMLIEVAEDASATIVSQAYEKIHKMREGCAKRHTKLVVEKGGFLIYSPLPAIPFQDAAFQNDTEIYLEDATSRLIYSEILTAGRVGRDENFQYRFYHALTKVSVGEALIYWDNAKYNPAESEMSEFCMFEGFTHLANILLIHMGNETLTRIREIIAEKPEVEGGATLTHNGDICVRVLGNHSEALLEIQEQIVNLY